MIFWKNHLSPTNENPWSFWYCWLRVEKSWLLIKFLELLNYLNRINFFLLKVYKVNLLLTNSPSNIPISVSFISYSEKNFSKNTLMFLFFSLSCWKFFLLENIFQSLKMLAFIVIVPAVLVIVIIFKNLGVTKN